MSAGITGLRSISGRQTSLLPAVIANRLADRRGPAAWGPLAWEEINFTAHGDPPAPADGSTVRLTASPEPASSRDKLTR